MRHRNISVEANQIGLNASAVVLQIKDVEKELGLALFCRTTDGVHPPTAGLAAVKVARAVDARLDELASEIDANNALRKGVFRLGVDSTAEFFAPHMLVAEKAIGKDRIAQEIELGRLIVLDVEGLPIHRQRFAVSHSDRRLFHALGAFQDFLAAQARAHLPDVAKPR